MIETIDRGMHQGLNFSIYKYLTPHRYGFQVKDLFENIFGTGSEENNEENVESPPVEDNSVQASSDSLVLATVLENSQ